jgi:hypothetical protein
MVDSDLEQLYTVLAFDPGGTTGWAIVSVHDGVIGPAPFGRWLTGHPVYGHERPDPGTRESRVEAAHLAWKQELAEAAEYRILDNVAFWACGQYTGERGAQVDEMVKLTEAWPDNAALVVEGFTLRQFRMDSMLLEPVRVAERYIHAVRPRAVLQQPPSLAMSMVTDDRLRYSMNNPAYYRSTAGRPHARDSLRHAFTFLRREKEARAHGRSLYV